MRLYIDPGMRCTGWALYSEDGEAHADADGRVVACGLSRAGANVPALVLPAYHRRQIQKETAPFSSSHGAVVEVVSETPWVRRGRTKGDPQDLHTLSLIAGRLAERYVYPHEWKGTANGDVFCRRILSLLTEDEHSLVEAVRPASLRHNAIDAVGLALWDQGRM